MGERIVFLLRLELDEVFILSLRTALVLGLFGCRSSVIMDGVDDLLGLRDVGDYVSRELFGVIVHVCFDILKGHSDRFLNFRQELLRLLEL